MHTRALVKVTWLALATIGLSGCFDCESDMEEIRDLWGSPTEVNRYDSEGYHSETWWYWSRGKSFTFTWGSDVSKACDMSTFTFTPIGFLRKPAEPHRRPPHSRSRSRARYPGARGPPYGS